MFLPLSDDDRRLVKPPVVTWVLLGLNVLVFLYQTSDPTFTYGYSAVPAEITSGRDLVAPVVIDTGAGGKVEIPQYPGPNPIYLTLLSSMFMHGGIAHLGGNMLFLWIFGDNVEHRFGHLWFLLFYLLSGLAASLAQIAMDPDSVIPTLGASGAISGVMGAYLVLFPRNRVHALFFYRVVTVPAMVVIAAWVVMQLVGGFSMFTGGASGGGVAYAAHLGGFVAGVLIAIVCRVFLREEPDSVLRRTYASDPRSRRIW